MPKMSHGRAMAWLAAEESFRDHWNHHEIPLDVWTNLLIDSQESFDPGVWWLAMDGDEVAGVAICDADAPGEPQYGMVATLGVRRHWRGRGIAMALEYGVKVTGVTVHFLDAGVDTGPIVLQEAVTIAEGESLESLESRIHAVEHRLLPRAVQLVAAGRVRVEGRRVRVAAPPAS